MRDSHENKMKNLQILSPSSSPLKWYFWNPIVYFVPVQIKKPQRNTGEAIPKISLCSIPNISLFEEARILHKYFQLGVLLAEILK